MRTCDHTGSAGYTGISRTSGQSARSASERPAARPAPAIGRITQNTSTPTAASGTVEASTALDDHRGAMTGARRAVERMAAMAPAADEAPSAISEKSSVSAVPVRRELSLSAATWHT